MTVTTHIDPARLRDALAEANIPSLVPLLVQLTGDRKWTREPYRPTRAPGLSDHDDGGLPEDIQQEIREAAAAAVLAWAAGVPAALPAPTGEQLLELMTLCTAEAIPERYEPMSAEHMGFRPRRRRLADADRSSGFHVVIIGAGISGLTSSKHLQDLGIRHTVIEKNDRPGGTWIENRYPGCGVDTPSYLYSLSYFWRNWSGHFGKRAELEQYLQDLTAEFDLSRHIRFSSTVRSATWDEGAEVWKVVVDGGEGEYTIEANAVISCVGQLNVPKVPALPGKDSFEGDVFHSARWPDGLELEGKRVAVVGAGASAMQIVPAIADRVEGLDVYQRSPQWISPNSNYFRQVSESMHWLMANVPYYKAWYRFRLSWLYNDRIHDSLQKDPDWPHPARALNATNDAHRRYFTRYIEDQLQGHPDLLEKALPDYPVFGKRMLLDNGWYAALKKENVELITAGVASLTSSGVVDEAGMERPADVVVLATGFEAHRPIRYEIIGRDGRSLHDVWGDDDARAYLGITTPGFPNLFFMYGPNTNLGHGGSFIFLAEGQIDYIVDALTRMVNEDLRSIECRTDVCDRYNEELDAAHERMVWTHQGMDTWYRNKSGRVVTNMPWRVVDYWHMTREIDLDDFVVHRIQSLVASGSGSRDTDVAVAGSSH